MRVLVGSIWILLMRMSFMNKTLCEEIGIHERIDRITGFSRFTG